MKHTQHSHVTNLWYCMEKWERSHIFFLLFQSVLSLFYVEEGSANYEKCPAQSPDQFEVLYGKIREVIHFFLLFWAVAP